MEALQGVHGRTDAISQHIPQCVGPRLPPNERKERSVWGASEDVSCFFLGIYFSFLSCSALRCNMNLNATQILHGNFRMYHRSIICWFVYEICQLTGTEPFLRGSHNQYICA